MFVVLWVLLGFGGGWCVVLFVCLFLSKYCINSRGHLQVMYWILANGMSSSRFSYTCNDCQDERCSLGVLGTPWYCFKEALPYCCWDTFCGGWERTLRGSSPAFPSPFQLLLCHIPHLMRSVLVWLLDVLQSCAMFKWRSVSFEQPDPESVAENCAGAITPNDFSPLKQVEVPEKTKNLGAKHVGDSISDTVSYVSWKCLC